MTGPIRPAVNNRNSMGSRAWIARILGAQPAAPRKPIARFADREPIEQILERASSSHYGVRSLIHELGQSQLF